MDQKLFCYHGNVDKVCPELVGLCRFLADYVRAGSKIVVSKGYVCPACNDTPLETAHQEGNALHINYENGTDLFQILQVLAISPVTDIVIYASKKYVHAEIAKKVKEKEVRVVA